MFVCLLGTNNAFDSPAMPADGDFSDDESLGRQVLPVADLPHDFDGIPEDGMQYLFMVR